MPSQWMSLLLRYQSRTTDDFRSFVSFLNLPIPEKQISSENIHNVLAGISEVTSNFDQQAFIAEQLVVQGFEKIMQNTHDPEELFQQTVEVSENILEKRLGYFGSNCATHFGLLVPVISVQTVPVII